MNFQYLYMGKIPDFYLKIATSNAYNLPPTNATFKRKTFLDLAFIEIFPVVKKSMK